MLFLVKELMACDLPGYSTCIKIVKESIRRDEGRYDGFPRVCGLTESADAAIHLRVIVLGNLILFPAVFHLTDSDGLV